MCYRKFAKSVMKIIPKRRQRYNLFFEQQNKSVFFATNRTITIAKVYYC